MMSMLTRDMVENLVRAGRSTRVDIVVTPLFSVGQRIRVKNINPTTHTRLTRYVRGKVGVVIADHGVFSLPDTMATGGGQSPQHLYTVSFSAQVLWGGAAHPRDVLNIDLWDAYMEMFDEQ